VADYGKIAFILCVLDLDFISGETSTLHRFGQVFVLVRQSSAGDFESLCVHFLALLFLDPDNAIVKSGTVADKWNKGCAELHGTKVRHRGRVTRNDGGALGVVFLV
jgi:hypothetical protein